MNYDKLFTHMQDEHGLMLLESEMQEIINIVNEMQQEVCIGRMKITDILAKEGDTIELRRRLAE